MRLQIRRWLLLAAVLGLLAAQASAEAPITLTFMHFNDDYQLGPVDGGKAGGLDRLAYLAKRVRELDPQAQLLFAGDLISPSLESSIFRGAQLIEGFNALGINAATLGNHEFDYGLAVLQERLAESRFPWITTNVYRSDFSRIPRVEFMRITRVHGIDIGYFGLVTRDTLVSSRPGPDIKVLDEIGTARAIVPILQRHGAKIIVGVTHIHMHEDQQILREVPGIHFIAGGHEHDPLRAVVGRSLVAKAGSDARWLGVVRLQVTPEGRVLNIQDELVPIN